MPIVSVIVPVFNTCDYLMECLNSIISQSFKDLEIICVNDGSKDNSLNVLEEYKRLDNRIKVINLKSNCGVSIARNEGLKEAHGKYVIFIDSDDFIESHFIETLFYAINDNNIDAVLNANNLLYSDGKICNTSTIKSFYDTYLDRLLTPLEILSVEDAPYLSLCGNIFRMSVIKENGISFPLIDYSEDWCFLHLYLNYSKSVMMINGCSYYYRVRSTSATHISLDNSLKLIKYYSLLFDIYAENGWLDRGIKLFNFKYLISILSNESYYVAKDFINKQYEYFNSNALVYSDCDKLIVESLRNDLTYFEYKEKYGPDFKKYFVLLALRKRISKCF